MLFGPNDPLPELPPNPPDEDRLRAEEIEAAKIEDAERRLEEPIYGPTRQTVS